MAISLKINDFFRTWISLKINIKKKRQKNSDFSKKKKISVESPIAQGLLGKKVGEITEIQVPSGIMKFEIVAITT